MGRGIMGLVRDFNQISYAFKTLERIKKEKETKFGVEVSHSGLGRKRIIRGPSKEYVEEAGRQQLAAWDLTWAKQQESAANRQKREADRRSSEQRAAYILKKKKEAENRTAAAISEINSAENILSKYKEIHGDIDWDALIPNPESPFQKPAPVTIPPQPDKPILPIKPNRQDAQYTLAKLFQDKRIPLPPAEPLKKDIGILEKISGGQKKADLQYANEHASWEIESRQYHHSVPGQIEQLVLADQNKWEQEVALINENYRVALKSRKEVEELQSKEIENWNRSSDNWKTGVEAIKAKIDKCRTGYANKDPVAVADYFSVMLATSKRPAWVQTDWEMSFVASENSLVINFHLPNIDDVPSIIGYSYSTKEDALIEEQAKSSQLSKLYDSIIYQLVLRCFYDVFKSDFQSVLSSARFTGYVVAINKATGTSEDMPIISATCSKQFFANINLAKVDPETCFLTFENATESKPHLLKKIPIYEPENTGEHKVLMSVKATPKSGDLAQIVQFSGETTRAKIIANELRSNWQLELSMELMKSKLSELLSQIELRANPAKLTAELMRLKAKQKLIQTETVYDLPSNEILEASEFIDLTVHSHERIQEILDQMIEIFNDDLIAALNVSDTVDEPIEIRDLVNKILLQISDIFHIENLILDTRVDFELTGVRNSFKGLTQEILIQCLKFVNDTNQLVTNAGDSLNKSDVSKLTISLEKLLLRTAEELNKFNLTLQK